MTHRYSPPAPPHVTDLDINRNRQLDIAKQPPGYVSSGQTEINNANTTRRAMQFQKTALAALDFMPEETAMRLPVK